MLDENVFFSCIKSVSEHKSCEESRRPRPKGSRISSSSGVATRGQQLGPREEAFLASVRRDLGQREEKRRGRELEDPVNFFTAIVACVSEWEWLQLQNPATFTFWVFTFCDLWIVLVENETPLMREHLPWKLWNFKINVKCSQLFQQTTDRIGNQQRIKK